MLEKIKEKKEFVLIGIGIAFGILANIYTRVNFIETSNTIPGIIINFIVVTPIISGLIIYNKKLGAKNPKRSKFISSLIVVCFLFYALMLFVLITILFGIKI